MNYQQTEHPRTDPISQFWTTEGDRATPLNAGDDVDDDVRSSYREVSDRAAYEREKEAARPNLETFDRVFGSPAKGGEFVIGTHEGFIADPIRAREHLKAEFARLHPDLTPTRERAAEPPDYLDATGRDEWYREEAVREAMRSAPREADWRKKMEEAEPFLARVWKERGELAKSLEMVGGVIQAATIKPQVWDKVSHWYGAAAGEPAATEEKGAAQSGDAAQLAGWLQQVVDSGALPGLENIEGEVVTELNRSISAGETGSIEQRLVNAYSRAKAGIQAELDRAAADKARHASRSLSSEGSHQPHTADDDGEGDDVLADTRRAYRRATAA